MSLESYNEGGNKEERLRAAKELFLNKFKDKGIVSKDFTPELDEEVLPDKEPDLDKPIFKRKKPDVELPDYRKFRANDD